MSISKEENNRKEAERCHSSKDSEVDRFEDVRSVMAEPHDGEYQYITAENGQEVLFSEPAYLIQMGAQFSEIRLSQSTMYIRELEEPLREKDDDNAAHDFASPKAATQLLG